MVFQIPPPAGEVAAQPTEGCEAIAERGTAHFGRDPSVASRHLPVPGRI
jgi:hypothetical protein